MAAFAAAIPANPRARFCVARLVLCAVPALAGPGPELLVDPGRPACRNNFRLPVAGVALVRAAMASGTKARTRSVAANPGIKNSG
jgi:hypothetical protein